LIKLTLPANANVIDLFAGPGGLGEGFSKSDGCFEIKMSVEMEPSSHQTLQLRSFVRHFRIPPPDYYDYIRGTISRKELFDRHPREAAIAIEETLHGPRSIPA
jgi:DNA (cytosine-5)-methyltransferase 1